MHKHAGKGRLKVRDERPESGRIVPVEGYGLSGILVVDLLAHETLGAVVGLMDRLVLRELQYLRREEGERL